MCQEIIFMICQKKITKIIHHLRTNYEKKYEVELRKFTVNEFYNLLISTGHLFHK